MNANTPKSDPAIKLAGYVDGELSAADRATIDAWIATDDVARAEMDGQRQLSNENKNLWEKLAPAPSEAAWARALSVIHAGLEPPTPVNYQTKSTRNRRSWANAFIALALTGLLAMASTIWPGLPGGNSVEVAEALPMATDDDVDVVSVWGDDACVIVGAPLMGPLDLATIGDTLIDSIKYEPNDNPMKPSIPSKDPRGPLWINPKDKMVPVP